MDFTSAFISMRQGHKVTRTTWKGYWCIVNDEIVMVTREGKAINLRESPDMMYTISNMLCDDWGVCDDRAIPMMPGESATVASKAKTHEDQKKQNNDSKHKENTATIDSNEYKRRVCSSNNNNIANKQNHGVSSDNLNNESIERVIDFLDWLGL